MTRQTQCLRFVSTVLAAACIAVAVHADDPVPPDTCIVEVDAPPGARVSLNGKDYGTKRRFTYGSLKPGEVYSVSLSVMIPHRTPLEKTLLIRGGWWVPVTSETLTEVELVLQTGHSSEVRCVAIGGHGNILATGSWDHSVTLWNPHTHRQLGTLGGHSSELYSIALSDDGRMLASGSRSELFLWDVGMRKCIATLAGHRDLPTLTKRMHNGTEYVSSSHSLSGVCAAIGDRNRTVVTGGNDEQVILWDTESGQQLASHSEHADDVTHVMISSTPLPTVLSLSRDRRAMLWFPSRQSTSVLTHERKGFVAGGLSNDGRIALTVTTSVARVWDVEAEREISRFEAEGHEIVSAQLSSSGKKFWILTTTAVSVVDSRNGKIVSTFPITTTEPHLLSAADELDLVVVVGRDGTCEFLPDSNTSGTHLDLVRRDGVSSLAVSGDGRVAIAGHAKGTCRRWHLDHGTPLSTVVRDDIRPVHSVATSEDGHVYLTAAGASAPRIRGESGVVEQKLVPGDEASGGLALTQNGRWAVQGKLHGVIYYDLLSDGVSTSLIDESEVVAGGTRFRGVRHVESVDIGPDGKMVLAGDINGIARLWDTRSHQVLARFTHTEPVSSVVFMPIRNQCATAAGSQIHVWDIPTGSKIKTIDANDVKINKIIPARSGKHVLLCGEQNRTRLVGLQEGRTLQRFLGHTGAVTGGFMSNNFRNAITSSDDGTIRLWDIATGEQVCSLLSFGEGKDWLVVTPEGLFDGSPGGREKVMYRVGDGLDVVPVDRFFQDFYYPGLLAAIWRGERPMPGMDFSETAQQTPPKIRILSPKQGGAVDAGEVTLEVELTEQGGGIKGPFLRQNGARVEVNGPSAVTDGVLKQTINVRLVEGENRIRIEAASGDGSFESEPALLTLHYTKSLDKPDLYVVAIGVNKYAEPAMNLNYARSDAEALCRLFQERGQTLYEQVHVAELLDENATKDSIRKTLRRISREARPQDTLLIHLSGHGFTIGQRYYFLPHEFQTDSDRIEDDIRDYGLPSDELADAIGEVPALKRMLILDTCNSGAAIAQSKSTARNPFGFIGAIERLSRAQGIYTIAASASSEETVEIRELGHGVLTYALLGGLGDTTITADRHADGNDDGVVNVSEWFGYAADEVPRLTKQHTGIPQDIKQSATGDSFPVLPVAER